MEGDSGIVQAVALLRAASAAGRREMEAMEWRPGKQISLSACWLIIAMLLVACGGGGRSSSVPAPPAGGTAEPPPPPVTPAPLPPTPAPTPPTSPAPPTLAQQAHRFLNQATFGATDAEVARLVSMGDPATAYERWIDQQMAEPASLQLPSVQAAYAQLSGPIDGLQRDRQEIWFRNAVTGPDQLRQRVAFALSEIFVVSQQSDDLRSMSLALADYYDVLARSAFGDFRTLLQDITLHPAMGVYLSMLGNMKSPDSASNIRPDENFAREVLQLFSIGLVQLNRDGTARLGPDDQPVPTFDSVEGFANVFTGYNYAGASSFAQASKTTENQVIPMHAYEEQHSALEKALLEYPGAEKSRLPPGQTAERDLADALDNIFHHPNVGPFIARRLIQRLVTSNPSPAYIARIASVFDDDGTGKRGNLRAVVKAILLDPVARAPEGTTAGKLKEPLLRLTGLWRAYGAKAVNGRYRLGTDIPAVFGQGPLQALSVFNFFSPDYSFPGEISEQDLVAPEMQIATEYLNTTVTNYFWNLIITWNSSVKTLPADAITLDVSREMSVAGDAVALRDMVATKLLGSPGSETLQIAVEAAIERVPVGNPDQRVVAAIYLVATSPEYVAQR